MKRDTKLIHAGAVEDSNGAVIAPIYQTSTFKFKDVDQGANRFLGKENGYIYTRLGNPTTDALARKLASLEEAEAAVMTSSGMGAIASVMWTFLKAGDRLISDTNLYGCTYALFNHTLTKFGIDVVQVDFTKPELVKKALNNKTAMVYFETPCNPNLKVIDIQKIAKMAHDYNKNIKVVVDNTFASPVVQRPITLGADLVVHSCTKYINGHADVISGAVVGSSKDIMNVAMVGIKDCTGAVLDPMAGYLINRGLCTLGVRMERHIANAKKVVQYLLKSPYVKKVNYPGIPTFEGYKIAKKQMDDFGGMLSFETNLTFAQTKKFVNSLKVWTLAVSLGGIESLIEHPASMTHSTYSKEDLAKAGISPTLIRIATGLEDVNELIADFDQAFKKAVGKKSK